MHPVLFSLGGVPVQSYYVFWTAALMLGVWWTRRRIVGKYDCGDIQGTAIIFWSLVGVYVGARVGSVLDNWEYFSLHPWRAFSPFEGGLSAIPAFLGAGLFGIIRSRIAGVPWWIPAEAASIPAITVVMIGRIGCFLNGCCYGVEALPPWGVHFPFDLDHFLRYPVQIYYSLTALGILLFLFGAERFFLRRYPLQKRVGALIWPFFMVFYGFMRFALDHLRHDLYVEKTFNSMTLAGGIALWGIAWLCFSLWRHQKVAL